jgi:Rrf2 family protein
MLTGLIAWIMNITKRGEYALRALIDIAIAKELGRDLIRIAELAEQERIPIKFLEQILTQLKEAGYVDSKRGRNGGYFLKMPADSIRFGSVIRYINGPLAPISCVSQTAYEPCTCPDEGHCGLRMLMLDVRNTIANILDRYTLADTVEIAVRKMRRDRVPLPFLGVIQLSSYPRRADCRDLCRLALVRRMARAGVMVEIDGHLAKPEAIPQRGSLERLHPYGHRSLGGIVLAPLHHQDARR